MRRQPLLSAAIVGTLAIGIGLDAGVFTVIDGMLFRPRVSRNPDTFVQIDLQRSSDGLGGREDGGLLMVGVGDYEAFRAHTRSLDPLAA